MGPAGAAAAPTNRRDGMPTTAHELRLYAGRAVPQRHRSPLWRRVCSFML